MAETKSNQKLPTDWVKLVNVSGVGKYTDDDGKEKQHKFVPLTFQYNGIEHTVGEPGLKTHRNIAEHARRKLFVSAWGSNRHRVEIEELPLSQRAANPDELPLETAKAIEDKDKRIAELEKQLAHAKK